MAKGLIILILLVCISLIIETVGIPYQTVKDGSHTGIITAVETSGLIFKTVTVYVKTDQESSQEDTYCLMDRSLIPELKRLEQEKVQVTVLYHDYFIQGWMNCNAEPGGIIHGVR